MVLGKSCTGMNKVALVYQQSSCTVLSKCKRKAHRTRSNSQWTIRRLSTVGVDMCFCKFRANIGFNRVINEDLRWSFSKLRVEQSYYASCFCCKEQFLTLRQIFPGISYGLLFVRFPFGKASQIHVFLP